MVIGLFIFNFIGLLVVGVMIDSFGFCVVFLLFVLLFLLVWIWMCGMVEYELLVLE